MSLEPETPLRDSKRRRLNRSSNVFNAFSHSPRPQYSRDVLPLLTPENLERLQAMGQGVKQLEENISDLSKIHDALNNGFNESFAGFLYGLLLNMFCSNYPACPSKESFEASKHSKGAISHINSLEERIHIAKLRRSELQEEVAHKTQQLSAVQARKANSQSHTRRMIAPPAPRSKSIFGHSNLAPRPKKVVVARDDTFSTNDSFIETPQSGVTRPRIGRDNNAGKSPNLNQAPRYMRGLFESRSGNLPRTSFRKPPTKPIRSDTAASRAERARRDRLAARPPFR